MKYHTQTHVTIIGIDEQMAGQIKALLSSLLPCALPVVDPEEFLGRGTLMDTTKVSYTLE